MTTVDLAGLPTVLRVEEAAAVLRVAPWTLYEAIKRGEVQHVRIGRAIRIPRRVVLEMLGESTEPGEGPEAA